MTDQYLHVNQASSGPALASLVDGRLHLQVGAAPNSQAMHGLTVEDGHNIRAALDKVLPPTPFLLESLAKAIQVLERVGCQFDYCGGPTLEPIDMITCYVCDAVAELQAAVDRVNEKED